MSSSILQIQLTCQQVIIRKQKYLVGEVEGIRHLLAVVKHEKFGTEFPNTLITRAIFKKKRATPIPYTSLSDHLLIVIDRKQTETRQLAQSCRNHNGGTYMLANSPSFP